jgi:uncharacterized protein (DUF2147 family)
MWRFAMMLAFVAPYVASFAGRAQADEIAGEWRVGDGRAHIRTVLCEGRLWGVVSWEKAPGHDRKNPDPALRGRSTLGIPVILGMTAAGASKWKGAIYNAEDGETYQASISLKGEDVMEVEGCVMHGWLCSGEDWTRIAPPPGSVGTGSGDNLCLRLDAAAARRTEQRRLK